MEDYKEKRSEFIERLVPIVGFGESYAERQKVLEVRRQENINNIIGLAAKKLPDNYSIGDVTDDWLIMFFNYCQDVSTEELQNVWASLLVREVTELGMVLNNVPRQRISLMSIHRLSLMTEHELRFFKLFCSRLWDFHIHFQYTYADYGYEHIRDHPSHKSTYDDMSTWDYDKLELLGLIENYGLEFEKEKEFLYTRKVYFGRDQYEIRKTNPAILWGKSLKKVGSEIRGLFTSEITMDIDYRDMVIKSWRKLFAVTQIE